MERRVEEIDISEETRKISDAFSFAIPTYDILRTFIEKTKPKLVISISECDYSIIVSSCPNFDKNDFEKLWGLFDLKFIAYYIANKYDFKSALIVYGEYETLLIFY